MKVLQLLLSAVHQLGKGNLGLAAVAIVIVAGLSARYHDNRVHFLIGLVVASPLIAALLARPIMNWTRLFTYDAARAAAFGGRRHMYYTTELQMMYVRGYPWVRLVEVCRIVGIGNPEKLARRMTGQECDSHDTDDDWLSEHGVRKLAGLPLGPEAAKFGAWFDREIVKPAAKMRDKGKPLS